MFYKKTHNTTIKQLKYLFIIGTFNIYPEKSKNIYRLERKFMQFFIEWYLSKTNFKDHYFVLWIGYQSIKCNNKKAKIKEKY